LEVIKQAAALVAPRDELEEQVCGVGLERQVAELVDDQQLGLGVEGQPLLQPAFGVALGQGGHQGRRGDAQDGVALADRLAAGRDRQMGLAHAGQPQQEQGLAMSYPSAGGEVAHVARIERRLGLEVKAAQVAVGGEVGDLAGHLHAPLVLAGDLTLAEEPERFAQGHLPPGRFVQQGVEQVADGRPLQPCQHVDEGLVVDHHHPPADRLLVLTKRPRQFSGRR
jgi:hypothetical protein